VLLNLTGRVSATTTLELQQLAMLGWLFNSNRTQIFPDHYALTQAALEQSICAAAKAQAKLGDLVFLLAHFPDTFAKTQDVLEANQVDYGVSASPIDWSRNVVSIRSKLSDINLALAEVFLRGLTASAVHDKHDLNISIIVVEKHPLFSVDRRLQQNFREIPRTVKAGYYLSFEQPVIKTVVSDHVQTLMKQFGMGNHSLVTSELISRRVTRRLKHFERIQNERHSKSIGNTLDPDSAIVTAKTWLPADGPENWLEQNGSP